MSYTNVKSFILILLLGAVRCMVLRGSNLPSSGRGSSAKTNGNIFGGGLSGYSGLSDIGVNINEINNAGGSGNSNGFGNIGDIGLGDLTSGGNNLWAEFQGIIGSVGGIGSSSSIGDIGLTNSDFHFGPDSQGSSSAYGSSK